MRALDEPMPQVGIFWYDMEDNSQRMLNALEPETGLFESKDEA